MRGFTLLELLVVLVIISLMSVLVVPQLTGSLAGMNLQTASKKISASLRYARSRAASEKITYIAIFDFEKDRLSIMTGTTGQEAQTGESLKEDLGDGEEPVIRSKSYDLPDGVKLEKGVSGEDEIDSGLFQISFFPTGSSSGGDVILINDRGKRYKISVDFITGVVRLGLPFTRKYN
jgi:general secretion pathway protein H